jgi:serine/threonine-protein kinase ATR
MEGAFRKSCEVTLGVMRNYSEPLMSVMETFVHDPLCEWFDKRKNSEKVAHNAAIKLATIEKKLNGQIIAGGNSLSVEGQVAELIKQAMDVNNLADMYIGWGAYL